MNSPFPYETLASHETFYGRAGEFKDIKKYIQTSNNLLIHSKRRMGKSTLIHELFFRVKEDYICIYCDIFDMATKEDFAKLLLKAISNVQKGDFKDTLKKFSTIFKRVRVEPSFDANSGKFSIRPVVLALSFDEMMEDFFLALDDLSKDLKVILAIDEFQQISTIKNAKLDALLRKYIQKSKNISWIFLGSKRHLLTSLFEYKAPLYELATQFELKPLSLEDVYKYVSKHMDISPQLVQYIYEKSDKETKLLQNICHILWLEQKDRKITKEHIKSAIDQIINSKNSSYKLLYDMLNNNQKIALKVLAKYKKPIYTQEVLRRYNIKKQTLQSSIKTLFNKELVDKNGENVYIPDRTLELWLESKFSP